ncbi:MAG TPA: TetR/AcrR family transcriptional regulator [Chromatiales bacterium]|nr:TetR/AcrR family transcriptional regulator [Chromatiales bacterium]
MVDAACESERDDTLSKGALSIYEVAERLFADKGFDAVSISDIALQAGVSKANVFHHFKSKEGLYLAVLKSACEKSARALDEVEGLSKDDPKRRLEAFFARHLQLLLDHPRATRLIQRELLEGGSGRGRRLAEEVFSEHFIRLVELVCQGQREGVLGKDFDAALLAFLLVGANLFFFETRSILKHLPEVDFAESPDHYSFSVFSLLSRGISKEI